MRAAWASFLVVGVAAVRRWYSSGSSSSRMRVLGSVLARGGKVRRHGTQAETHRHSPIVTSASVNSKIRVEKFGIGKCRKDIIVELSPEYGRKFHPEAAIEQHIDDMWRERMHANPRLFNGTKFRYGLSETSADGSGPVTLKLWFTDYRTYLGADLGRYIDDLVEYGGKVFGQKHALLSRKLGVSCLVVTSTTSSPSSSTSPHIILIKRSDQVAVDPGMIDCPGGHPEPASIGLHPKLDNNSFSDDEAKSSTPLSQRVVDELFESALLEIRDEVNVELSKVSEPKLLGAVHMAAPRSSVSLTLLMETSLEHDQIRDRYEKGAAEAYESTALLILPVTDVLKHTAAGSKVPVPGCAAPVEMTAALRGSLQLLEDHLQRLTPSVSGQKTAREVAKPQ